MLRLAGHAATSTGYGGLVGTDPTQVSLPSALQLFAQQKTVLVAVAVEIVTHDVASGVDIIRIRRTGSRHIDGSKVTLA